MYEEQQEVFLAAKEQEYICLSTVETLGVTILSSGFLGSYIASSTTLSGLVCVTCLKDVSVNG